MQETFENLRTQPDLALVNNIKENNDSVNDSIEVLAARHSGLYISTVFRITGNSIPNLKDELLGEKLLVVYNAAKSYDATRGSCFSTHFANETKWNCLKNKSKKSNREIPCEHEFIDSVMNKNDQFDTMSYDDDKFIMEKLLEEIELIDDERAKKIMRLRYFSHGKKNLPWKKIAKEVQLSIQGCINIHDKCIDAIKKNIKKKYKGMNI